VNEIRGSALFKGYRGAPPVNTATLLDLLHRVSRLAIEQPEIRELDLNPVVVFPGNKPCFAVDARIRLARMEESAAAPAETVAAGGPR
jgi:acyl-CoA synthetase (NDP forming)